MFNPYYKEENLLWSQSSLPLYKHAGEIMDQVKCHHSILSVYKKDNLPMSHALLTPLSVDQPF